jgi:hypothetical protein
VFLKSIQRRDAFLWRQTVEDGWTRLEPLASKRFADQYLAALHEHLRYSRYVTMNFEACQPGPGLDILFCDLASKHKQARDSAGDT